MTEETTVNEVQREDAKAADVVVSADCVADKVATGDVATEDVAKPISTEQPVVQDTKLDMKIVRQIEYYFGDANMPKDNFLKEETKKNNGWVKLETLLIFNRLKQLTTDANVIVNALTTLGNGLIEINEEKDCVRRNPDLPVPELSPELMNILKEKSLYVKVFPLDYTLDDLLAFFEKYGKVSQVLMRRDQKKKFKGSVFVIFEDKETSKKFLEDEIKLDDVLLEKKYRHEYNEMKAVKRQEYKEKELLKRNADKATSDKMNQEQKDEELKEKIVTASVLETKGYSDGTTREMIKEVFGEFGSIAWVNFSKGDKDGSIRFNGENSATETLAKAKGDNEKDEVKVNEAMVACRVLEGEEEFNHWKNSFAQFRESTRGRGRGRGGRGRGGRGGRGGRDSYKGKRERWANKRMGDDNSNNDATSAKVVKADV